MSDELPAALAESESNPSTQEERPCEVCSEPVGSGDRWAVLRADGEHWRHPWHTEPV